MSRGVDEEGSRGHTLRDAVYSGASIPAFPGSKVSLFCDHCGQVHEPEHVHDQLQLSLVFEPGVCDYTWRDAAGLSHQQHIVGPQFLVVAPTVPHTCHWQKDAEVIILYLDAPLREELLPNNSEPFIASDSVAGATQDLVVWQLAASLRSIYFERSAPDSQLLHSVAATVAQRALKVLSGALPLGVPGLPTLSLERVKIVEAYIDANMANHIQVSDLAKKVGLSQPHFTALFTATKNLAPYEYITRCRMLKAYDLLKAGDCRIAEVAIAVGFPDQGYFTKRFKEYFRFSPRSVLLHTHLEPAKCPNKP